MTVSKDKSHSNHNGAELNDAKQRESQQTFAVQDEDYDPFQEVMQKAGNHGKFQTIYNWVFVCALAMAGAMIYMNIILALNIPDHWCTVPGRERTNFTLAQWRDLTLPREKDNRGAEKFSSCQMYNANFSQIDDWRKWNSSTMHSNATQAIACQNGWTYDLTWYERTIPTQENWVCEKDLFVTNVFVAGRVNEVVGSFVLGQMGDIFGRRLVYYISVFLSASGRIASIFTTSAYTWFLILSAVAMLSINSLFQSPQIVGMEISREQDRSTIALMQSFGWSMGSSIMPLLFWWLRDWVWFMWLTTLPTAIILLFSYYVIESPRWLISRRRFDEAIVQFKKIAKINGRKFDMTANELANIYSQTKQDSTYGLASLFNGWRLAKNTTIMGFSWCVVAVSYFTLVLFSSRMGGNPFLNFLLQSIVEIPSYALGKFLGDRYGRRFTNSMCFLVSFLTCVPIVILAVDIKYEAVMIGLATFIKFLNATTWFITSLQCMEIYPTCMRQTGISLGTILANAIGILAPYLVYLGTSYDIRCPYYILGTLFLIGGISASFLPETLHKKLPDTLDEARNFGKHDKYFSLPKAPAKVADAATEKLDPKKHAP